MPAKLDYQSVPVERFERPVHICGRKPPQRRRSRLKISAVASLLFFVLLLGWREIQRQGREADRRQAMAIVGTLTPQDEVVHLEREGFQDQSVFIELTLTARMFAEMKADAELRAIRVSDPGTSVPSGPSWWRIPRWAVQVNTPRRIYFFDADARSVHVYEWYW